MKAVEAFIGAVLMVGTVVLSQSAHLPTPVVTGAVAVIGVLTTVKVWLTRNEPLIEEAVEAAVELGQGVASAGKTK
jgi:hypothetical protein